MIILHFTALYCTFFILLTFTLLYFTLLYFTSLHYTLLYFTLFSFIFLDFTLLYFILLYFPSLYFTLLNFLQPQEVNLMTCSKLKNVPSAMLLEEHYAIMVCTVVRTCVCARVLFVHTYSTHAIERI